MQVVAKKLAMFDPNNIKWTGSWTYATRRADCIDAARQILETVVERLPAAAHFHFNLACYECQLGNMETAKARLKKAFELEKQFRVIALDDEDLKPLWDSLGEL